MSPHRETLKELRKNAVAALFLVPKDQLGPALLGRPVERQRAACRRAAGGATAHGRFLRAPTQQQEERENAEARERAAAALKRNDA
jgi:hypothetical protein